MTTNVFFNNFGSTAEQLLIEDLVVESIRIYGHDLYYCPRKLVQKDDIFNEDAQSKYDIAYTIEMYIKNVEGFEGEGDFLSKFGIQIRDEITFTVSQRIFNQEISAPEDRDRPQEGDLIYFPLTEKVYVVKFVEHEAVFYQMGSLQTYDLRCELFEYSNEKLDTGVAAIDDLEIKYTTDVGALGYADTYANGDIIIDANTGRPTNVSSDYDLNEDPFSDNTGFQTGGTGFIDFTETDPFSEGNI